MDKVSSALFFARPNEKQINRDYAATVLKTRHPKSTKAVIEPANDIKDPR